MKSYSELDNIGKKVEYSKYIVEYVLKAVYCIKYIFLEIVFEIELIFESLFSALLQLIIDSYCITSYSITFIF